MFENLIRLGHTCPDLDRLRKLEIENQLLKENLHRYIRMIVLMEQKTEQKLYV